MTNVVQWTINRKSVDGGLGIRRMEGVDESTELWRSADPTKFTLV